MATVLDTLSVPRAASALSLPTRSHIAPAVSSSLSSFSTRISFPLFKGLKVGPTFTARSLGPLTVTSRRATSAGPVVCEVQDTAVEVPAITDANWQSLVLESESPVLVEFWAPWCGPCRMIHPVIDELAKQYAGKIKCYKVNTDESASIATRYGIRSIPTVIIFKNGEKKDTVIGAVPKSTLTTSIEKFL